ncbi:hypothetical protein BDK51DRAFT_44796 [Blyttiomyces helicus]|uniref:Aminotransferase class I/classII domain-containing protein n=1 Tax=Blyttiomyces helicus TaxID=388810 RepID=A0A4V1ISE2_9FUNG|nr:hypothetical protein BDK51DRAFT_44796 [Blyttiomyces helicus]|eukprot:RKO93247.1 hypothetical protein BDK51DRAFT_44796 [Blyttiomyces helicus]
MSPIRRGRNAPTSHLATLLRARGFDVRPIRSPTVPRGTERVRVCIHTHNTEDEVVRLGAAIGESVVEMLSGGDRARL